MCVSDLLYQPLPSKCRRLKTKKSYEHQHAYPLDDRCVGIYDTTEKYKHAAFTCVERRSALYQLLGFADDQATSLSKRTWFVSALSMTKL